MHCSSHRLLAGAGVLWTGSLLVLTVSIAPQARAQDMSIGGLGAASSISSSMSAQGMGSSAAAMRQARGAGGAGAPGMEGEGPDVMGGDGAAGPGMPGATNTTTTTVTTTRTAPDAPLRWGNRTGEQLLSELMAGGVTVRRAAPRSRRSARQQAAYSRRLARMTPAQRKRMTMAKYQIPPRGWLAHYLKADRYKVTSGVWKFVTTPNDPYYYVPSAAAMMRKPAGEIIGFYSWQDAMLAGYRPDPVTKPAPGAQLAQIARLSRGPMLARYIEYVYTGQVRPDVFNYNYNYTMQVARTVMSHKHTRPHVGVTINQVIGATIGQGSLPQYVGANGVTSGVEPASVSTTGMASPGGGSPAMPSAAPPMGAGAAGEPGGDTGGDRRVGNFEEGRRRFGGLAR